MNTDSNGTANGATTRATTRDRGLVSSREPMDDEAVEYLTCRSTHRTGSTCGMKLGAAALPVERTGRVLDRLRLVSSDCIAVWCPRCRRATEYRYLTALESAA